MLHAILESAVNAILAIDSAGRIHSVNPAAERMFGYRADELLGQNVNMLMPEPYRSKHDGYLARYLTTGEKRIIGIGRGVEGQRKDGTVFPMHLAVGEFVVEGEPYFSGIVTDLSTHASLQAEIDRQSLLFQTVFDHVPEALVIADPNGQIILLNPAAMRMFGYEANEAVGLNLAAIFDRPHDMERLEAGLAEYEFQPDFHHPATEERNHVSGRGTCCGHQRLRRISNGCGQSASGRDRGFETKGRAAEV